MMEKSRRAKRMERHHKQRKQPALNMVSLMDIFTILVFFLLVSSSSTQQLPNSKNIKLPTSVATKAPKETIVIAVTKKDILVQGRKIASILEVLTSSEVTIAGLNKELLFQSSIAATKPLDKKKGRSVTIIGDEALDYELLRRILATCRQSNYTNIAFAALQKARKI